MNDSAVKRLLRQLTDVELTRARGGFGVPDEACELVLRDGSPVLVSPLAELLDSFYDKVDAGAWTDRTASDAWLAPRLHHTFRLSRREAADRRMWAFVANVVAGP